MRMPEGGAKTMRYKAISEKPGHSIEGAPTEPLAQALLDLREHMLSAPESDGFKRKVVLYLYSMYPYDFVGEISFYHDTGLERYLRSEKDGAG